MDEIREKALSIGLDRKLFDTMKSICSKNEECSAVEIEKESGLRQPDVSIATVKLYKTGYINRKPIIRERGKGRPHFLYTKNVDFYSFLNDFIVMKEKEISETEKKLDFLRNELLK